MKNRNIFTFAAFLTSAVCLCSCVSRGSDKVSDADELGDTVPASEFQIVEDTVSATTNDSISINKDR